MRRSATRLCPLCIGLFLVGEDVGAELIAHDCNGFGHTAMVLSKHATNFEFEQRPKFAVLADASMEA
jgi:hypothetical protein